jgi:hypothetical protein
LSAIGNVLGISAAREPTVPEPRDGAAAEADSDEPAAVVSIGQSTVPSAAAYGSELKPTGFDDRHIISPVHGLEPSQEAQAYPLPQLESASADDALSPRFADRTNGSSVQGLLDVIGAARALPAPAQGTDSTSTSVAPTTRRAVAAFAAAMPAQPVEPPTPVEPAAETVATDRRGK